jgi:AcrR family transcriptional regulator
MSTRPPPDATRRSERARRAILTAAVDLVAEVGYANLTIEAIAARAGVGKQTIYRWWRSKGAVVFDGFLFRQQVGGDITLPDTGDLRADLTTLLRSTIDDLVDPRVEAPYRALNAEIQHDPQLASDLVDHLLGPLLEATRQRLRSAQRAGQIAADVDLNLAVELLYGPIYHRWLLRTAPLTAGYAEALAALVLRALGTGSST